MATWETSKRIRQDVTTAATLSAKRELNANLFGIRLGPYIDVPLGQKWMMTLNLGFALVAVDSEFKFNDSVLGQRDRGSDTQTDWLPGAYVGGNVSHAVTPSTRIFAGAEYQYAGDFTQDAGGRRARLNLGNSVFLKARRDLFLLKPRASQFQTA